jgi:hypothetical protein
MKQLRLAVEGRCDPVPRLVDTHPYRADVKNLPIKERRLSGQDLRTFGASGLAATLVMWNRDSVDAAVHLRGHPVVHPVEVLIR